MSDNRTQFAVEEDTSRAAGPDRRSRYGYFMFCLVFLF